MNWRGVRSIENGKHQCVDGLIGNFAPGRDQQLPLRHELTQQAVIRRVATWLYRVARTL
jgi:hypothetical protein